MQKGTVVQYPRTSVTLRPTSVAHPQYHSVFGRSVADRPADSLKLQHEGEMRMHLRRFTRLTNAFSKKAENRACAGAIHFMWYNFAKIHQTLRITPAMAAGVTDRVWDAEAIVRLLDNREKEVRL